MINAVHTVGGHSHRIVPESYHTAGGREDRGGGGHAPHSHGAAHFQDIDNRLGSALEADVPTEHELLPDGTESVDVTRFHVSTHAPSRQHFVDALRSDTTAVAQMKALTNRMPKEAVDAYTYDVLRRSNMRVLDTNDKVDENAVAAPVDQNENFEEVKKPTVFENFIEYMLQDTPRHLTIRLRSKIKLANGWYGQNWDIFQVVISLIACGIHIDSTFRENALEDDGMEVVETTTDRVLELTLSFFFAVDLLMGLYVCDHRIWFWVKPDVVVDVLTLFPVVISLMGSSLAVNTSFLRALRMLRAMRILRAFRVTKNSLSPVDQKVVTLIIIIVSIIFMSACLVQVLEKENGMQDFGVAMYFVVVTISTVGYGDYSPSSAAGRAVVCVMIIGFMVVVPVKISELADLLAMRSPWHTTYRSKKGFRNILLMGSVLEVAEVAALLEEFYHPDRMKVAKDVSLQSTEIVIMAPYDPSEALIALMAMPIWQGQVFFVLGSPLSDRDLRRAGAGTAEACFILIGKQSSPPRSASDQATNQELVDYYDSQNVLYTLMVEHFNHRIKTFVEIRGQEKRYPLVATEADVVLCIDRLRMTMLGATTIFPGLCTLMANLWQSSADLLELEYDSSNPNGPRPPKWKSEYAKSRGMEIYVRPATNLFVGLTFSQVAFVVNRAFDSQVTLLGIEERLVSYDDDAGNPVGSAAAAEAAASEPEFRILRSLVAPGDAYVFPDTTTINAERQREAAKSKIQAEYLEVHVYFLADDNGQADLFATPEPYLANILHSLHEFAYLHNHMKFPSDGLDQHVAQVEASHAASSAQRASMGGPEDVFSTDDAKDRLIDSAPRMGISGHYIILMPPSSLSSVHDILLPLRGGDGLNHAESIPMLNEPVVVMLSDKVALRELPLAFLKQLKSFPAVYALFGDHNSVADLTRAGIMQSKSIVIVEDNDGMGSEGSEIHTATITKFLSTEQCLSMAADAARDADERGALEAGAAIAEETLRMQSYVVESNTKSTMAIMNRSVQNRLSTERIDRDARESAASALLEDGANSGVGLALLVRARHKALRKEEAEKQEALKAAMEQFSTDESYSMTPFFAAGYVFSTIIFDNLLVLSYFSRGVLSFTEIMLGLVPNQKETPVEELVQYRLKPSLKSGKLVQIPIPIDPDHLRTASATKGDGPAVVTYTQVFDLLLVNYEAVVLAVYRAPDRDSQLNYVASPEPTDVINWDDKLFIVAPPHQVEKLLKCTDKFLHYSRRASPKPLPAIATLARAKSTAASLAAQSVAQAPSESAVAAAGEAAAAALETPSVVITAAPEVAAGEMS